MSYTGNEVAIPMGQQGLKTDDAATALPPTVLIEANNVTIFNNSIEKEAGSAKYNSTALPDGVVALYDWWPTTALQRLIAVIANGSVYRDTGDGTFNSNTAIKTGLGSLTSDVMLVAGGNETAGNNKKLFFFTGTSQVQVLTGDGTSLAAISSPAADWSSNYPTFAIPHRNRIFAFGNANDRHRIYASDFNNHEDFAGAGILTFSVFPGEGDGLKSAIVYKGRLYVFKQPTGVYYLVDDDPDSTNWYFAKYTNSFGVASPSSLLQVMDDLLAGNSSGTITSLQAVQAFGDLKQGDIIANGQIENYIRAKTTAAGYPYQQAIYYEEKKIAYFTYRARPTDAQNRMLEIDIARQVPRFTFNTKDQATCLTFRRDSLNIKRPIYGSTTGFIYKMDQADRNVGGAAYSGDFQTPHMDFAFADPKLANKNKIFEFLTLVYKPVGSWNVNVEVYIDGVRKETIPFSQLKGHGLDDFILDVDTLGGTEPEDLRKRLHGQGRRISFRVSNNVVNQNFKIEQLIVGFRISDEKQNALSESSV